MASHTQAFGIDRGNVVGYWRDADGYAHGFIAAIPESARCHWLRWVG